MLRCQAGRSSERAPPPAAVQVWACTCQHRDQLDFIRRKFPKILSAQICMCAQPSATILGSIQFWLVVLRQWGAVQRLMMNTKICLARATYPLSKPSVNVKHWGEKPGSALWSRFFYVSQQGDCSNMFTFELLNKYVPAGPRWGWHWLWIIRAKSFSNWRNQLWRMSWATKRHHLQTLQLSALYDEYIIGVDVTSKHK